MSKFSKAAWLANFPSVLNMKAAQPTAKHF